MFLIVSVVAAATASPGLRVEVYGNSVMGGTPRCTTTLPNDFNRSIASLCPAASLGDDCSLRIEGTLTAAAATSPEWRAFSVSVGRAAWVRLWIDDHRLVDQWSGPHSDPAVTPGLLPNVTLAADRPVFVRVDLRPWAPWAALALSWRADAAQPFALIPTASALSDTVSSAQTKRRVLQRRAASGWNQWARHSQLANIVLPQQVGVDLALKQRATGATYTRALVVPTHGAKVDNAVRMGSHAYDGTFAELSFVPFPRRSSVGTGLNITVASATVAPSSAGANEEERGEGLVAGGGGRTRVVLVSSNASTAAAAAAANLSVVVSAAAYWSAAATLSVGADGRSIALDAGELGVVTATFSQPPLRVADATDATAPALEFAVLATPLAISLSFAPAPAPPAVAAVSKVINDARATLRAQIVATGDGLGGGELTDVYDAMVSFLLPLHFTRILLTI
jgi:hypothetical protein